MLVAIAGSIGAGKSTVAGAVAARLAIPLHSIDEDKLAEGSAHEDFRQWVAQGIPFPDAFRVAVFERTLSKLRQLARDHEHVVVEETFHRRKVRDPFFREAGELFGGMLLIEITVERGVAMEHLASRRQSGGGHLAGRAMFDAFQDIADPLEDVDLRVPNNGDLADTVEAVCAYLEPRLFAGGHSPPD